MPAHIRDSVDYEKMAEVASSIHAFFMVDMAHIGGLVAAKAIPNPVPVADFVTLTSYKTMMGGRGGIILCKKGFAKQVDRSIFPGCQGTSAVNSIAAKAVILKMAMRNSFVTIQEKTIATARALSESFIKKGYRVLTNGTDTHQVILEYRFKGGGCRFGGKSTRKIKYYSQQEYASRGRAETGHDQWYPHGHSCHGVAGYGKGGSRHRRSSRGQSDCSSYTTRCHTIGQESGDFVVPPVSRLSDTVMTSSRTGLCHLARILIKCSGSLPG